MSSPFIRLYLDEDVDVLLAGLVRARGFEAVNKQMTLLTHNRADFEKLFQERFEAQHPHSGIIIAVRRPVYDLAKRVLVILNAVASDEMQEAIRHI